MKFITGETSKWSGNEVGIEILIAYRQEQIFQRIQIYRYIEWAFACGNSYKEKGPLKLTENLLKIEFVVSRRLASNGFFHQLSIRQTFHLINALRSWRSSKISTAITTMDFRWKIASPSAFGAIKSGILTWARNHEKTFKIESAI
jgi:hypothetical protein